MTLPQRNNFIIGLATISRCSKKQNIVVVSSFKAKSIVATMATQECIWLKRIIQEIVSDLIHSVPIHYDNESATKLARNPMFHPRTKHIETHYHFIWEKVLTQDTKLLKIQIEDEVAEIFTKGLGTTKFEVF